MKLFFLTSCLLILTVAGFSQTIKKVKVTEVEEYIKNSDHPIVLNCWATWCAPCVEEIPYFMETVKKYRDQKVELLLVSLDFASYYPGKIQELIKKKKFEATFFWLNETNADYFCPKVDEKWFGSIPATLFIYPKRNYRRFFEKQLKEEAFEQEVKAMLGAN